MIKFKKEKIYGDLFINSEGSTRRILKDYLIYANIKRFMLKIRVQWRRRNWFHFTKSLIGKLKKRR